VSEAYDPCRGWRVSGWGWRERERARRAAAGDAIRPVSYVCTHLVGERSSGYSGVGLRLVTASLSLHRAEKASHHEGELA